MVAATRAVNAQFRELTDTHVFISKSHVEEFKLVF